MQQRYFIGITLPDNLTGQISKVQNDFFQPGKTMQPLIPHITLLPPNMLEGLPPEDFVPEVKRVADKFLPAAIKLSKISMFGQRVIYIKAESKKVVYLYEELMKLLPNSIGSQSTANRKFEPHITLAQAKPKQKLDPKTIKNFSHQIAPLLPQNFQVNALTQFTWQSPRNYKLTSINKF